MQVLFKFNFRTITADTHSRDAIRAEGFDTHFNLAGFIDKSRTPPGAELVSLISNGWRNNPMEHWQYLEKGQYIQGALLGRDVYVLTHRWQPVVVCSQS